MSNGQLVEYTKPASMLTGLLPSEHGFHTYDSNFCLGSNETFLASLPDHRSVAISANIFFSPRFGFDAPFDEFVSISTGRRFPRGLDVNEFVTESEKESIPLYLDYLKTALTRDHPLRSLANGVLAQVNVSSTNAPIPKLPDDGASTVVSEAARQTPVDCPVVMLLNFGDAHVPLRHNRHYDRNLHSADNEWTLTASTSGTSSTTVRKPTRSIWRRDAKCTAQPSSTWIER